MLKISGKTLSLLRSSKLEQPESL